MRLGKNELRGLAGVISFGMLCAWPYAQFSGYKKYQLDVCSENVQITTGIISGIGLMFFKTMFCYYFFQKCVGRNQRAYSIEDPADPNLAYLNLMLERLIEPSLIELEQRPT
ncbi:MAG: hypothetical protein KR126chlam3_00611 [Chlamydiae bacterium]|nr:hypothetical protein [Chlamydiota bacterium]